MHSISQANFTEFLKRHKWLVLAAIALLAAVWFWRLQGDAVNPKSSKGGAVLVVSAVVAQGDVSVRLTANGTVSAQQTVEVRPQISATIYAVHIKEGQFVHKGDKLFTLDTRAEAASLSKAVAQLNKDRADLVNAERNLERQRELFQQKFISQAAFDTAQNQVDGLRGQLAVDQAAVETSHVSRSFGEITAPISGRTGVIAVYPGSLVQPNGAALVSITQIDPINVSFTLPENELAALQQARATGRVTVSAVPDAAGQKGHKGWLSFIDNAVDTASGTIRVKAEFANADNQLWPGMFVSVSLAPRLLAGALTVPVQAVQIGPEKKFLYVIGEDSKVTAVPVSVRLIQDGFAVIEGVAAGTRVVVEGAQNIRPGSVVSEAGAEKNSNKNTDNAAAKPNRAEQP
ncbi:MAG TPA: efflux RND transporter periplasmic adaptor subunit [Gallionellaceae bacterium]|nr:efflux RND transporter periplasmic adaptor subunit [Gallionellaceae bacterium]